MISKKSRKVIAAVLIGATVCASGTFAYFNSVLDLNSALDNGALNKSLKITNGHVEITGKIGGAELSAVDHLWYYDVASKSAMEDLIKYAKGSEVGLTETTAVSGDDATKAAKVKKLNDKLKSLGINFTADTTTTLTNLKEIDLSGFVNAHLSPDFTVDSTKVSTETGKGTTSNTRIAYNGKIYNIEATEGTSKEVDLRAAVNKDLKAAGKAEINTVITNVNDFLDSVKTLSTDIANKFTTYSVVKQGAEINPGSITLTRPGDAIGLGKLNSDGSIDGLEIVNKSTITTKLDIRLKTDSTGAIDNDVVQSIKGLADAGWVLYINDTRFDFSKYLTTDGTIQKAVKDLQTELINNSAVYAPGNSKIKLNVKLELPLMTGNAYQDANTSNSGSQADFDVTQLFDIVATQENNPGVNEDGTNDPLKSNKNSNKGGADATINNDNGQLREGTLD